MWIAIGIIGVTGVFFSIVGLIIMAATNNPRQKNIVLLMIIFILMAVSGFSLADNKTYSPEIQQAAFENWNKTFEDINTRHNDAWEMSANAITGLSNGNINSYQAYTTLANAETQLKNIYNEYDEMVIPKQLSEDHQQLLKEAAGSMATAAFTRIDTLQKLQQYLDDPKPTLLADSEMMLQAGQQEMINALATAAQVDEALN